MESLEVLILCYLATISLDNNPDKNKDAKLLSRYKKEVGVVPTNNDGVSKLITFYITKYIFISQCENLLLYWYISSIINMGSQHLFIHELLITHLL